MRKIIMIVCTFYFILISCSKEDSEQGSNITPTVENIAGSYKITKIIGKFGSDPEEDVTDYWLDNCEKDDLHRLNNNLVYQWIDAGNKCDPEGGTVSAWSLDNSTTITIDGDSYTIKKFTGKTLELIYQWNPVATLTATYIKQ